MLSVSWFMTHTQRTHCPIALHVPRFASPGQKSFEISVFPFLETNIIVLSSYLFTFNAYNLQIASTNNVQVIKYRVHKMSSPASTSDSNRSTDAMQSPTSIPYSDLGFFKIKIKTENGISTLFLLVYPHTAASLMVLLLLLFLQAMRSKFTWCRVNIMPFATCRTVMPFTWISFATVSHVRFLRGLGKGSYM